MLWTPAFAGHYSTVNAACLGKTQIPETGTMEMKGLSLIIALASGGLKAIGDITLIPISPLDQDSQ